MKPLVILLLKIIQIAVTQANPAPKNTELARKAVETMIDRSLIVDTMSGLMTAQADKFSKQA